MFSVHIMIPPCLFFNLSICYRCQCQCSLSFWQRSPTSMNQGMSAPVGPPVAPRAHENMMATFGRLPSNGPCWSRCVTPHHASKRQESPVTQNVFWYLKGFLIHIQTHGEGAYVNVVLAPETCSAKFTEAQAKHRPSKYQTFWARTSLFQSLIKAHWLSTSPCCDENIRKSSLVLKLRKLRTPLSNFLHRCHPAAVHFLQDMQVLYRGNLPEFLKDV